MIRAIELAYYTVHKCTQDERPVSNLQLQKMLYFIQLTYCRATKGELLFNDEFEAWPYGPVLPDVYEEYSFFGGGVIDKTYPRSESFMIGKLGDDTVNFLNDGIEILRNKYPWDLVRSSHAPGSPWDIIYKGGDGYKKTIPNKLLRKAALATNNVM